MLQVKPLKKKRKEKERKCPIVKITMNSKAVKPSAGFANPCLKVQTEEDTLA